MQVLANLKFMGKMTVKRTETFPTDAQQDELVVVQGRL